MTVRSGSRAVNVRGKSGDPNRGNWCTPKWLAKYVGPWDLDPFSNPRSHIVARDACMLEDGGDGFGDHSTPGSYRCAGSPERVAQASARVWIQPPYSIVQLVLNHYRHTRWCALLRFDPRPKWFDDVYEAAELVCVIRNDPDGKPFNFEPPPGVTASSNMFPHALFYRRADDVTDAALRHTIAWRKRATP